ncbi:MAG: rod shape-determining protein MreD [Bacteroidales bacterium]
MSATYFKYIAGFIFYLLLQVLILNNLYFLGWATPYLYVYFLMTLPKDLSPNIQLTIGLLMGFFLDLFSNTLGMNMTACVIIMFLRPFLLNLFGSRDDDYQIPSFKTFGVGAFMRYATLMVLIHHFALNLVQFFSFDNLPFLLLRIVSGSLLTLFLIALIEAFNLMKR